MGVKYSSVAGPAVGGLAKARSGTGGAGQITSSDYCVGVAGWPASRKGQAWPRITR